MAALLYRWKFDEGSGQYAYDSVANVSATMYTSTPGDRYVGFDANGYDKACLEGDGTAVSAAAWEGVGARVAGVSYSTPPTKFTWTLWYKASSSQSRVLFCLNQETGGSGVGFNQAVLMRVVGGVSVIEFHYWPPAGGSSVSTSTITDPGVHDGNWHFVAVTMDGSSTSLYWDDCETAVDTNSTASRSTSGTFRYRIGGGSDAIISAGAFFGLIDDVRVYNGALTPAEICAVKTDFGPPPITNAMMFSCNT